VRYKRTIDCIGYSFVPNHTATMEALARVKLSGREFRIVLFIMRQTNGYLREEDQISPAFFELKTGIGKDHIPHVLARLQKLGIVTVIPGRPPTYSVNPPQRWKPEVFAKNGEPFSPNLAISLAENGENQLRPIDNLKKTNYKDISNSFINNNSQSKYTRGKYGHMVATSPEDVERIKGAGDTPDPIEGGEHGDTEHTSSEEADPDAGPG